MVPDGILHVASSDTGRCPPASSTSSQQDRRSRAPKAGAGSGSCSVKSSFRAALTADVQETVRWELREMQISLLCNMRQMLGRSSSLAEDDADSGPLARFPQKSSTPMLAAMQPSYPPPKIDCAGKAQNIEFHHSGATAPGVKLDFSQYDTAIEDTLATSAQEPWWGVMLASIEENSPAGKGPGRPLKEHSSGQVTKQVTNASREASDQQVLKAGQLQPATPRHEPEKAMSEKALTDADDAKSNSLRPSSTTPEPRPWGETRISPRPSKASPSRDGRESTTSRKSTGFLAARRLRRTNAQESCYFDFNLSKNRVGLDVEMYDVSSYYKQSGWAARFASSETFMNATLAVIIGNAFYIGVEANNNSAPDLYSAWWPYQLAEQFFCAFFFVEWIIRFSAFDVKQNCLKDFWFKLDSCLVALGIFDTWVVPNVQRLFSAGGTSDFGPSPLRLLRLARLARSVRLFKFLPELVTMMKGMKVAARAVGSSLLLLALMIYVFSIAFFTLCGEEATLSRYFSSLPLTMWTLLLDGVLMDSPGKLITSLRRLDEVGSASATAGFLCFSLLANMTVMNMLIGILCEVVSAVSHAEKENAAIAMMKKSVLVMLHRLDEDGSGEISKEELSDVIRDPEALAVLEHLSVDVGYLMDLQEWLYQQPGKSIPIGVIMERILAVRGDNDVKVKDLVDCNSFNRWAFNMALREHQRNIQDYLHSVLGIADDTPCPYMEAQETIV